MKAERVVVVVWAGGVRASETILDPRHRYLPRIWNDLAPQGTLLTRLYNDGWTNHGPALQALATGRWEVTEYADPRPAPGRTLVDAARHQGRSQPRSLLLDFRPPPKDQAQARRISTTETDVDIGMHAYELFCRMRRYSRYRDATFLLMFSGEERAWSFEGHASGRADR